MKRFLKFTGILLGSLFLVALIGAVALYFSTDEDYVVPATVSDNPSLPRIEIDGYTFHVETFGEPDNPVVIVLHGGPGGDYRSLLGLQALADEYFVVFYDQRGSGLSKRVPAEQLTYQSTLHDLDAIIDLYGKGEPVYLVGHSWGGMLASGYLGYAPEKIAKAVMAEPGFLNAQEQKDWQAYFGEITGGPEYLWVAARAGFAAFHVNGPDEYASEDFLVGANILPYFENHPDNPYHCPGEPYDAPMWRWGNTASSAIQSTASSADLDSLSAHAGDYEKPVLFLASECNTWIGPELQANHAALYPNSQLVIISNSGHDMVWDNPEETIQAIRTFLDE
ncbi:MAG: alpha/beta hydrolase [Anaerolineales bacterium]|nr:alpha/beta hydrolase [Anaerolineales bacterium]